MVKLKEWILQHLFEVIFGLITTGVLASLKSVIKSIIALKHGMLSLLRAELIHSTEKNINRGYAPIYAKDAIEEAYKSYHSLGGNGTITQLVNKTMNLPIGKDD